MADITAAMVKELRERTQAGMSDCKSALVEAGGDMTKAVEILQKKGAAKAVKAAGRVAADGAIAAVVSSDGRTGAIVEVNCQTDFVAKGDDFQAFAKLCASTALANKTADAAALEAVVVDGKSLKEHADGMTAKSGEKHAIRRVAYFEAQGAGLIASYIHFGARLGVLLELTTEKGSSPEARELADELTLQVASMNPRYVVRTEAPADTQAKQKEIFAGQLKTEEDEAQAEVDAWKARMAEEGADSDAVKDKLKALEKKAASLSGRPAAAKEKIVEGKLNKWLAEATLTEQTSVRDNTKTINAVVADFAKANGPTQVARFARFELGEGIEKAAAKDFATEVAEMAAAAQKS